MVIGQCYSTITAHCTWILLNSIQHRCPFPRDWNFHTRRKSVRRNLLFSRCQIVMNQMNLQNVYTYVSTIDRLVEYANAK